MIETSPARRWAALAVLAGAVLLLSIDGTVLALAVPALTESLAPTSEQILWIGDIYSLVLAGLLAVMGNLADRFGRKRVLLTGSVMFGLASVLAAFAPTAELLIAARALLAVAGATLMPSTLSLIRNLFPDPAERTRAIAIWATAFGAGAAIGPLTGGFLLEHFWWGSIFLINVPVMLVVLVSGLLLLPESRDPDPGPFDMLSALLSMATTVPVVYAITHLVADGPGVTTLTALALGPVAGVLFVRRQRRLAHPMLDVDLFRSPAFSGAVVVSVIAVFAQVGLLFFFSQYLQFVRGYSPLEAGLAEMPLTIGSMVVVAFVGVTLRRLGRGRAIAVALALAAAGIAAFSWTTTMPGYVGIALALAPVGLGLGLAMTLAGDATVSAAPPHKAGSVAAVTETGNELGVALGIAVLGSLVTAVYRGSLLLPPGVADEIRARAEDSIGSALAAAGAASEVAEAARDAFVTGMQVTALVAAALTAVAAVAAWLVIPSPRNGEPAATVGADAPAAGTPAGAASTPVGAAETKE